MSATATATTEDLGTFEDMKTTPDGIVYEEVDGWGKKWGLLSIHAGEVLEWNEDKNNPERSKEAALRLLARSFVSRQRQRLCQTPQSEEAMVKILRDKDSRTVNLLVKKVLDMNGIVSETADKAKND